MLLITCPFGTSSALATELSRLGYTPENTFPTGTFVDGDLRTAGHLNLRSRVGNKVFLRATRANIPCSSFEDLFQATDTVDRSKYIGPGHGISVSVHTRQSTLDSTRTIQSITHKAILTKLTGSKEKRREIDEEKHIHDIFVVINQNKVTIYINTSGMSLHNRGYRKSTGQAPIKENLAAALIIMSRRHWKQSLRDPCCGSGTIPIEAAMKACNIAPGLNRDFAMEVFPTHKKDVFDTQRKEAKEAIFTGKSYEIIGTDTDSSVLEDATHNARRAGVGDVVKFKKKDILSTKVKDLPFTNTPWIITNPPYGQRLKSDTIMNIHKKIPALKGKQTTLITGFEGAGTLYQGNKRKRKKAKNGADEVGIFLKF